MKRNTVSVVKTFRRQLRKMTGSNVWAVETGCMNSVLHRNTNVSTALESYCERKTAKFGRGSSKCRSLQLKILSSEDSNIVYSWYFFYCNVDIASLLWIKSNSFHLPSLILEYTEYFQTAASLVIQQHLSLPKRGASKSTSGRDATKTSPIRRPVSRRLSFLQIFCIQLSKVETLNIIPLNFQPFERFSDWDTVKVAKGVRVPARITFNFTCNMYDGFQNLWSEIFEICVCCPPLPNTCSFILQYLWRAMSTKFI
jgi:hypothetical protein